MATESPWSNSSNSPASQAEHETFIKKGLNTGGALDEGSGWNRGSYAPGQTYKAIEDSLNAWKNRGNSAPAVTNTPPTNPTTPSTASPFPSTPAPPVPSTPAPPATPPPPPTPYAAAGGPTMYEYQQEGTPYTPGSMLAQGAGLFDGTDQSIIQENVRMLIGRGMSEEEATKEALRKAQRTPAPQ